MKPVYLKRIEDKDGNILYEANPEILNTGVISQESAEKMVYMMRNVVNFGTASRLRTDFGLKSDLAGKTGTTQRQTDGWYIGFTPDLIAGVWVGGDNPVIRFRSLAYGQGAYTALPIWGIFMKKIYKDPLYKLSSKSTFNISENVREQMNCPDFKDKEYDSIWEYLKERDETLIDLFKRVFRKNKRKKHINNTE
jgi:penicillin-binding protein 1A